MKSAPNIEYYNLMDIESY